MDGHGDRFLYLDLVSAVVLQRTRRGAWLSQSLRFWINLLWTLTACQHLETRQSKLMV